MATAFQIGAPSTDEAAPQTGVEVLITAEEAYPALERAFLAARAEVLMGFRIFDPATHLRSPEGRRIGERWSDLIVHTLRRGVAVTVILSDFDPVGATELHRSTWRSVRQFEQVLREAGPDARLDVRPSIHPGEAGLLPRIVFLPMVARQLAGIAAACNRLDPERREQVLRDSPGLGQWLVAQPDGTVRLRIRRPPRLHVVTHHQKLAVFDGDLLYIGGLDLNDRRFDTKDHIRDGEETWQDVQVMLRGQPAREAKRHLESFIDVAHGRRAPLCHERLLVTLSARRRRDLTHISPRTVDRSIGAAHHRLIDGARALIYLETQFFRDLGLARRLERAARRSPDLGLILLLPAAPEEVAFTTENRLADRYGEWLQTRCFRRMVKAFGPRFFAASPVQPRAERSEARDTLKGAPLVYVHSKVSIFDTGAAIVSSANLNGRSLAWDTEAGVLLDQAAAVEHLQRRVFEHWLGGDAGREFFHPRTAVAAWRAQAITNARADPADRQGFLVPYDFHAAEAFGVEVPGVPEEMV